MPYAPTDLLTDNGWYIDMQGLISPQFHSFEGLERKTGEVKIVDGATNITYKFSDQLKDFGEITLIRTKDGSVDDITMVALTDNCINNGFRFDFQLVKNHNGNPVFRILVLGARIKSEAHPSLKTDGTGKYDMKYMLSVTEWVEVPF